MSIKKFIAAFLTAGMMMTFFPATAMAASNGWNGNDSSGWRYYTTSDTYVKSEWKEIGGKWYYFDSNGYMESNCYRNGYWLTKTGAWDGRSRKASWQKNSTGWWYEDDGWYPESRWLWIDGECYYFDSNGYMEYSCYRDGCWLRENGTWDKRYSHGTWKKNSTGWWYEDNGWYPKNQWLWIDGSKYYFDKDGYWNSSSIKPTSAIIDKIQKAILNREDHLRISEGKYDDISWDDIHALSYGSFWLDTWSSTAFYLRDGVYCKDYYFEYYDLTDSQISKMKGQIDQKVNEIVACIPSGASDYEKAKIVHDQLISRIVFVKGTTVEHQHDLYGALVNGKAVCTGYSSAYKYILNDVLGIPCAIVNNATHSFNKIGNSYVDVGWDDLDATNSSGKPLISYYYFGMTYNQITSTDADHKINYYSYNDNCDNHILSYYYEAEGYMLSKYDYNSVVAIYKKQYDKGIAYPAIIFTNKTAYNQCKEAMGSQVFWSIFSDVGCTGSKPLLYPSDNRLMYAFTD